MFLLTIVSHPVKIMEKLVTFPAPAVTNSAVLRILGVKLEGPGARM